MSLEFNWEPVGNYVNILSGFAFKSKDFINSGIPVVKIKNIVPPDVVLDDVQYVSEKFLTEKKNYVLSKGDILITLTGSSVNQMASAVGQVAKINFAEPCLLNQRVAKLIPKDESKCNIDYFYYILSTEEMHYNLASRASGSANQANINPTIIKSMETLVPPIEIQNKIVGVLKTIDEKINVNKEININLFSIASSLQTEWIVNFTPFKSEQFKSSAFGLIPKDWNVGKLGDVIELLDSKRIPLSGQERENMEKIYPYYGAASLMDYVDDYIFDGIYLLIGEDGTVIDDKGFPILQYVWGKFWVNNHAHIVKGKNGFNVDSLYLLLSKTNIQSIVTGAVQAKVNQNNLKSIEIIIPPVEVMEKFNELIKPFFDTIRSNHDEIKELQKLRDTLLPKLMSGEIDVSKINCDMLKISMKNLDNTFTLPLQNILIKAIL